MNQQGLETTLSNLNLSAIRYFDSIGSTNDEALTWASQGAEDLSLVVADEQTQGRGRLDRPWFTPPQTALAFSLILRLTQNETIYPTRMVGLAALALADALQILSLDPQIKWPNDILLNEKKNAGILIESAWSGNDVDSMIIGMGVNIKKNAVPPIEKSGLPAISLEHVLGFAPDRKGLLHSILANIIALRPHIGTDSFIALWEKKLAYIGRQVQVDMGGDQSVTGEIAGLESDGSLRLLKDDNKIITVQFGDVHLRLFA